MATHTSLWLLLSLAATAFAQGSIIPSGLTSGFTDSLGLEVSYQGVGTRFDGIPDGSTVSATDVSTDPIFALSDQSAINTRIAFLIMMLDTTDPNAPVLHFAQDQFKADGVQTGISTQAQPLVPYARPGSLGETGQRQYSFLLFQEPSGTTISGLPQAGETLNVDQFLASNNMRAARAGVGIMVDNGGGGGGGGGGAAAPSAPATTVAPSNTPIATFTSVIPTPPIATSEATVPITPSPPIATGQPLPSSTLLTSAATGAATPSASATSGSSGASSSATSSGSGAVTAGGSVLEAVPARTLGLVAGLIGGVLLI
ncbi:hypothetical protein INS49_005847 [Diaporthe citri]|uniref:uncharacterized protein n=1 Tax=Diaporthe citri TaxID=83186 RepID=UPI001C823553|nr:uncharacterized protein INS49_005847 [Diaporthe citri]KAG6364248.1 hypothetical protein INS49_005847 [Diaporthe citri]